MRKHLSGIFACLILLFLPAITLADQSAATEAEASGGNGAGVSVSDPGRNTSDQSEPDLQASTQQAPKETREMPKGKRSELPQIGD